MEIVVLGHVYQRILNHNRKGVQKGVECRLRVRDGDRIRDARVTIYNEKLYDACTPTGNIETNAKSTFERQAVEHFALPYDISELTVTNFGNFYVLENAFTLVRVGYVNFLDERNNDNNQSNVKPEHDM